VAFYNMLPAILEDYDRTDPLVQMVIDPIVQFARFGQSFFSTGIGLETFVSSLSENGDLLSQWRGYADNGTGFSIGFDPARLRIGNSNAALQVGELRRVIYDPKQHARLVKDLINGMIAIVRRFRKELLSKKMLLNRSPDSFSSWIGLRINELLAEWSFQFKDSSFSEECEWRIIASKSKPIDFRSSLGRVVPYLQVDMTAIDGALMPVSRIYLGPKQDETEAARAPAYVFNRYGYGHDGIEVVKSRVPYR
jgi:hypothetical protein